MVAVRHNSRVYLKVGVVKVRACARPERTRPVRDVDRSAGSVVFVEIMEAT